VNFSKLYFNIGITAQLGCCIKNNDKQTHNTYSKAKNWKFRSWKVKKN